MTKSNDKESKKERKQKKFLLKKFNGAVTVGSIAGYVALAASVPMAFIDGGMTFAIMAGTYGAAFTGIAAYGDFKNKAKSAFNTAAGQRLYGPGWAQDMYNGLQESLLLTNAALNMHRESPKKVRKLEKKKEKIMDTARDLSVYLITVDKKDEPTDKPILYLARPLTGDAQKDHGARVNPFINKDGSDKPKPLSL